MMSYAELDFIADLYIPCLFVLFLADLLLKVHKIWPRYQAMSIYFCFLPGLLLFSYGIMFLDNKLHLWPSLGLDYSTHTAVALSLVLAICVLRPGKWKLAAISMLAYVGLMLYQQYHSVLDIVSTGLVIGLFAYVLRGLLFKKRINEIHL